MKLYLEGHNHKLGYAVSVEYSDEECSVSPEKCTALTPVRFYESGRYARRVIERFNARIAA